jgi:hypothetical protein
MKTKMLSKISKKKLGYLSLLYDELYKEADRIIKKHKPCEIKRNFINGEVSCLDSRQDIYYEDKCLCCTDCPHLTKDGCSVKSLPCKLWFCFALEKKYPKVAHKLSALTKIAQRNHLWHYRMSKQEIFKYLIEMEIKEQEAHNLEWKLYREKMFRM